MNVERCRLAPERHADRCECGRRARWHVDCDVHGCGNYCGIHARAIQRRSLWSAVFNRPHIIKETSNMELTEETYEQLLAAAEQKADEMLDAGDYQSARIGQPLYSAASLRRGGWSCVVTMFDDHGRDAESVEVYVDGSSEPRQLVAS